MHKMCPRYINGIAYLPAFEHERLEKELAEVVLELAQLKAKHELDSQSAKEVAK